MFPVGGHFIGEHGAAIEGIHSFLRDVAMSPVSPRERRGSIRDDGWGLELAAVNAAPLDSRRGQQAFR